MILILIGSNLTVNRGDFNLQAMGNITMLGAQETRIIENGTSCTGNVCKGNVGYDNVVSYSQSLTEKKTQENVISSKLVADDGKIIIKAGGFLSLGDTDMYSTDDRELFAGTGMKLYRTASTEEVSIDKSEQVIKLGKDMAAAIATAVVSGLIVGGISAIGDFKDKASDPTADFSNGLMIGALGGFLIANAAGAKNLLDMKKTSTTSSTKKTIFDDKEMISGGGKTVLNVQKGDLELAGVNISGDDGVIQLANNGKIKAYALNDEITTLEKKMGTGDDGEGWEHIDIDLSSGKLIGGLLVGVGLQVGMGLAMKAGGKIAGKISSKFGGSGTASSSGIMSTIKKARANLPDCNNNFGTQLGSAARLGFLTFGILGTTTDMFGDIKINVNGDLYGSITSTKSVNKVNGVVLTSKNGEVEQIALNGITNVGSDLNTQGSGKVRQDSGLGGIQNLAAQIQSSNSSLILTGKLDLDTSLSWKKIFNYAPVRSLVFEKITNGIASFALTQVVKGGTRLFPSHILNLGGIQNIITSKLSKGSTLGDLFGEVNLDISGSGNLTSETTTSWSATKISNANDNAYWIKKGASEDEVATIVGTKNVMNGISYDAINIRDAQNTKNIFTATSTDLNLAADISKDGIKSLIDALLPNNSRDVVKTSIGYSISPTLVSISKQDSGPYDVMSAFNKYDTTSKSKIKIGDTGFDIDNLGVEFDLKGTWNATSKYQKLTTGISSNIDPTTWKDLTGSNIPTESLNQINIVKLASMRSGTDTINAKGSMTLTGSIDSLSKLSGTLDSGVVGKGSGWLLGGNSNLTFQIDSASNESPPLFSDTPVVNIANAKLEANSIFDVKFGSSGFDLDFDFSKLQLSADAFNIEGYKSTSLAGETNTVTLKANNFMIDFAKKGASLSYSKNNFNSDFKLSLPEISLAKKDNSKEQSFTFIRDSYSTLNNFTRSSVSAKNLSLTTSLDLNVANIFQERIPSVYDNNDFAKKVTKRYSLDFIGKNKDLSSLYRNPNLSLLNTVDFKVQGLSLSSDSVTYANSKYIGTVLDSSSTLVLNHFNLNATEPISIKSNLTDIASTLIVSVSKLNLSSGKTIYNAYSVDNTGMVTHTDFSTDGILASIGGVNYTKTKNQLSNIDIKDISVEFKNLNGEKTKKNNIANSVIDLPTIGIKGADTISLKGEGLKIQNMQGNMIDDLTFSSLNLSAKQIDGLVFSDKNFNGINDLNINLNQLAMKNMRSYSNDFNLASLRVDSGSLDLASVDSIELGADKSIDGLKDLKLNLIDVTARNITSSSANGLGLASFGVGKGDISLASIDAIGLGDGKSLTGLKGLDLGLKGITAQGITSSSSTSYSELGNFSIYSGNISLASVDAIGLGDGKSLTGLKGLDLGLENITAQGLTSSSTNGLSLASFGVSKGDISLASVDAIGLGDGKSLTGLKGLDLGLEGITAQGLTSSSANGLGLASFGVGKGDISLASVDAIGLGDGKYLTGLKGLDLGLENITAQGLTSSSANGLGLASFGVGKGDISLASVDAIGLGDGKSLTGLKGLDLGLEGITAQGLTSSSANGLGLASFGVGKGDISLASVDAIGLGDGKSLTGLKGLDLGLEGITAQGLTSSSANGLGLASFGVGKGDISLASVDAIGLGDGKSLTGLKGLDLGLENITAQGLTSSSANGLGLASFGVSKGDISLASIDAIGLGDGKSLTGLKGLDLGLENITAQGLTSSSTNGLSLASFGVSKGDISLASVDAIGLGDGKSLTGLKGLDLGLEGITAQGLTSSSANGLGLASFGVGKGDISLASVDAIGLGDGKYLTGLKGLDLGLENITAQGLTSSSANGLGLASFGVGKGDISLASVDAIGLGDGKSLTGLKGLDLGLENITAQGLTSSSANGLGLASFGVGKGDISLASVDAIGLGDGKSLTGLKGLDLGLEGITAQGLTSSSANGLGLASFGVSKGDISLASVDAIGLGDGKSLTGLKGLDLGLEGITAQGLTSSSANGLGLASFGVGKGDISLASVDAIGLGDGKSLTGLKGLDLGLENITAQGLTSSSANGLGLASFGVGKGDISLASVDAIGLGDGKSLTGLKGLDLGLENITAQGLTSSSANGLGLASFGVGKGDISLASVDAIGLGDGKSLTGLKGLDLGLENITAQGLTSSSANGLGLASFGVSKGDISLASVDAIGLGDGKSLTGLKGLDLGLENITAQGLTSSSANGLGLASFGVSKGDISLASVDAIGLGDGKSLTGLKGLDLGLEGITAQGLTSSSANGLGLASFGVSKGDISLASVDAIGLGDGKSLTGLKGLDLGLENITAQGLTSSSANGLGLASFGVGKGDISLASVDAIGLGDGKSLTGLKGLDLGLENITAQGLTSSSANGLGLASFGVGKGDISLASVDAIGLGDGKSLTGLKGLDLGLEGITAQGLTSSSANGLGLASFGVSKGDISLASVDAIGLGDGKSLTGLKGLDLGLEGITAQGLTSSSANGLGLASFGVGKGDISLASVDAIGLGDGKSLTGLKGLDLGLEGITAQGLTSSSANGLGLASFGVSKGDISLASVDAIGLGDGKSLTGLKGLDLGLENITAQGLTSSSANSLGLASFGVGKGDISLASVDAIGLGDGKSLTGLKGLDLGLENITAQGLTSSSANGLGLASFGVGKGDISLASVDAIGLGDGKSLTGLKGLDLGLENITAQGLTSSSANGLGLASFGVGKGDISLASVGYTSKSDVSDTNIFNQGAKVSLTNLRFQNLEKLSFDATAIQVSATNISQYNKDGSNLLVSSQGLDLVIGKSSLDAMNFNSGAVNLLGLNVDSVNLNLHALDLSKRNKNGSTLILSSGDGLAMNLQNLNIDTFNYSSDTTSSLINAKGLIVDASEFKTSKNYELNFVNSDGSSIDLSSSVYNTINLKTNFNINSLDLNSSQDSTIIALDANKLNINTGLSQIKKSLINDTVSKVTNMLSSKYTRVPEILMDQFTSDMSASLGINLDFSGKLNYSNNKVSNKTYIDASIENLEAVTSFSLLYNQNSTKDAATKLAGSGSFRVNTKGQAGIGITQDETGINQVVADLNLKSLGVGVQGVGNYNTNMTNSTLNVKNTGIDLMLHANDISSSIDFRKKANAFELKNLEFNSRNFGLSLDAIANVEKNSSVGSQLGIGAFVSMNIKSNSNIGFGYNGDTKAKNFDIGLENVSVGLDASVQVKNKSQLGDFSKLGLDLSVNSSIEPNARVAIDRDASLLGAGFKNLNWGLNGGLDLNIQNYDKNGNTKGNFTQSRKLNKSKDSKNMSIDSILDGDELSKYLK